MALLYAAEIDEAEALFVALTGQQPDLDIRVWPEFGAASDIEFAIVAGKAPVDLNQFPNLRGIQSTWAGVNALLADPRTPKHVPLARMVAPEMTGWMSEYVIFHVLDVARRGTELRRSQAHRHWCNEAVRDPKPKVGILGLGELGGDIAGKLVGLGYEVSGWTRRPRDVAHVACFAGRDGLPRFLGGVQILVCLLPLTEDTREILDANLFAALPPGSTLIHAGRGAQLVEADLLLALKRGHLDRAILDVFATEPLPADHPFWVHPAITISPHVAAISRPGMGAALILANYRRALAGQTLVHQVDRARGY